MPGFEESAVCRAPGEEVRKLLYDPARFPEWWVGVARVEVRVDVPEAEAKRLEQAWEEISASLPRLVAAVDRAAGAVP